MHTPSQAAATAPLRQIRRSEDGRAEGPPHRAGAGSFRRSRAKPAAWVLSPREDRPRSPKRTAWRSTVPAKSCRRADVLRARAWPGRHRRDALRADPPASHDAGARPHKAAEHPHAHAQRQPYRTAARGTMRRRRARALRRARARKTDRAGRQTTPLWRAPASSSERTWRQTNAISRFSQGTEERCPITSACPISRQCGLTLGDLPPKLRRPWPFLLNFPEIPTCSFPTRAGHGCGLPSPC